MRPRAGVLAAEVAARDLMTTTAATFMLTIANPATILSFAAIFAGLGLAGRSQPLEAAALVVGVFCGSLGWWFFLSGVVSLLRSRLPQGFAAFVGRASALIMLLFGLLAIGLAILSLKGA
jgi:putative LysE/RhtB family amino acid efflux pump